ASRRCAHRDQPTAQPSGAHADPCRPSHEDPAGGGPLLVTPHYAAWGGPRAGANLAHAVGKPSAPEPPAPSCSLHVRQYPPPASTPYAGEHVEVQRPPQQLCPVHWRRPLLHPLRPGRCLNPRTCLLRTCLGVEAVSSYSITLMINLFEMIVAYL